MERLFQLLETVAPTNSTILITGETGTGKEVVARAIHHNSPRRAHRFVALNCSAIPGDAARGGAVRPRARRVHRRGRQPPGTARAGAQGHAVPRRSRDDERGAADEAAARAAGARVRARRRLAHDQGRRPRDRRDQQRPGEAGRRRPVPRGSVLPAQRHPGAAAAAARAQGRHPAAGPALPREVRVRAGREHGARARAASHGLAGRRCGG